MLPAFAVVALTVSGMTLPTAQAVEVAVKSVKNGDATISYYAQGKGPLILLIASTGRGTKEFGVLANRLGERGYRVLRPEPRGVGASKGPMQGVSFHDFANDFAAVIHNEGGKAIVAGHAYGSWIARTLAADHPDLTRGIVLVAAGAKKWPKELSHAITMINDAKSTRDQRLEGLRLAFFAKGSDPTPWLEGWHPDVTKSQRAARKLTNQADWWAAGGRVPILDLQGGADPFRPASSRQDLKKEFGDRVTVKVIDGASHALPAEKTQAVADAIADWADRLKD